MTATKQCRKCGEICPLNCFNRHPSTKDRLQNHCKPCRNKHKMKYILETGNASCKKYEKTKNGFLVRTYRNMKSRTCGIQKAKFHLYEGKSLLDKKEFYEWSLANVDFHTLFDAYVASGYQMKLAPSIDRRNSLHGYELWNMRWITHSENSRMTSRFNKNQTKI